MDISLEFAGATGRDVSDLLSDIGERVVEQARARANNRALEQCRTFVRRAVSKETSASASLLNNRFRLYRAALNKPTARLFIGTSPIRAYDLGIRQLRRGVSFGKGRSRTRESSAFVATMRNKRKDGTISEHVGLFKREGKSRLPIKEVTVAVYPSARRAADSYMATIATGVIEKNFRSDLQFRINREIDRRGLRLQ